MSPVAIVAFILAACSGGLSSMPAAERSGLTSVKVALNWFLEPEFGGFYEGVLGGHYTAVGLDVESFREGRSALTLELPGSGRAQVALTAADDLLLKRTKGIRAVGAWPGFQLNPLGLMVHEGPGPADFAAIASMTDPQVAIEVGGPFQTFLWKRHGWESRTGRSLRGLGGSLPADPGFIQQAYVTSEPCVARARAAVRFLKASDAGWNHYGSLVAFADPPPPWAARFVAATQQAWAAYLEQPARANAEIARLNDQMTP